MKSLSASKVWVRRAAPWLGALVVSGALAQPGAPVPTMQVGVSPVSTGFDIDGVVEPVKQSTVAAQTGGRIVTLAVRTGDRVRAGQLLAVIDDREAAVGMQRSRAQVAQSEAELMNAKTHLERTTELQAKGFVSQASLDMAQTQFQAAQAGRAQADAGARHSGLMQGYTRVKAPYDGWVLETHAEAGDLAVPGRPLVTVFAAKPLRAVVQVPASRAQLAHQAGRVEVQLNGDEGRGEWIEPVAKRALKTTDPVSQTVEWRLDLPSKAAQSLRPGDHVRVRFVAGTISRMVVPAQALLRRGELTAVYVAGDHGFSLRAVRLGANHGAEGYEVVAGLTAGERIALEPVKAGLAGAQVALNTQNR
ncbi:MAG: efflux RND transporter periplasmic adaptor subunit [Hylemonella sp.]|nr:efflux RND transporter periplasmic adaptor subunit [Hylemonella sp.]MDH5707474.1 efflux RND transporter periplasmic adaptor subunit [Hylemonella sp.]